MTRTVDYHEVTALARSMGLRSLYHNSGAFGFAPGVTTRSVGWVGPPDPTIRPAAQALARHVPPPYEPNLADLATRAWLEHLAGPAWVLPKSHWAYELDFGSAAWMPSALRDVGVDPGSLVARNDGTALEFQPSEADAFTRLVGRLLRDLAGSDFALLFPNHPVVCTLHHHKQIWWTTSDEALAAQLEELVGGAPAE